MLSKIIQNKSSFVLYFLHPKTKAFKLGLFLSDYESIWQLVIKIYRVSQKKRGISECCSVCSTVQFMLNLEFLLLVHLKVEIHMCVPSTEPSLSDIRELKNVIFKYIIQHQLLIRSQMNSIIPILHRLTSA